MAHVNQHVTAPNEINAARLEREALNHREIFRIPGWVCSWRGVACSIDRDGRCFPATGSLSGSRAAAVFTHYKDA